MSLIGFLITLLIIAVILWGIRTILPALGLPEPIRTVIWVIVVVLCVVWLLSALTGWAPGPLRF